jgi:hypothetical protein
MSKPHTQALLKTYSKATIAESWKQVNQSTKLPQLFERLSRQKKGGHYTTLSNIENQNRLVFANQDINNQPVV